MDKVLIENPSTLPPKWNHPILPGNAVQGMVLLTKNDFKHPPQSSEDFMWVMMEKAFGVHNIRLFYDNEKNVYTIQASEAHLKNDGTWLEDWREIGTITGLSAEAEQKIQDLVYVSYRYDTTTANTLKVYGVKKDDTEELLCNITFASKAYVDEQIAAVDAALTSEAGTRETNDSALEARIEALEAAIANTGEIEVTTPTGTETIVYVKGESE